MQVIQVEFEGRNPMTSDFHGIRQLLHQLFLKSDINLSELADIVTGMYLLFFFVRRVITVAMLIVIFPNQANESSLGLHV